MSNQKSSTMLQEKGSAIYVYLATAVAAVGGFLFGFDTAIIGAAITFITKYFTLDPAQKGWAVSAVIIGCMIGASIAGVLSDKFGRKKTLIGAGIFFVLTAILTAVPHTLLQFALARGLMGIAVGIDSLISPLYIAEIAPAKIRGRLVALNQVALMIGMVCAYIVGLVFAMKLSPDVSWRWMFASGAVPAALFLFALIGVPESPRWLAKQDRFDEAQVILAKVGGKEHAKTEVAEMREAISQESGDLKQLFRPGLRIALMIGIMLAIFQQVTGINAILYYAPQVFKDAGFPIKEALIVSIALSVVNVLVTLISVHVVDRVGRKFILILGTIGMTIFLALVGYAFHQGASFPPILTAVFITGYVACFGFGLGPGVWLVMSEIFPTRIRGRAMSIATFFVWASCFVVSLTFPMLLAAVGAPKTFWLFGVMSIATILFVWRVVPETKGRTLENIEMLWLKKAGKLEP